MMGPRREFVKGRQEGRPVRFDGRRRVEQRAGEREIRRSGRTAPDGTVQSSSFSEENRELTLTSLVILEAYGAAVFMHLDGSGI
jgi:hypothetical protein